MNDSDFFDFKDSHGVTCWLRLSMVSFVRCHPSGVVTFNLAGDPDALEFEGDNASRLLMALFGIPVTPAGASR